MGLINKDTLNQILTFYPPKTRSLIKHQISMMEEIISKNQDLYTKDKGYQKAIDYVLKSVIEGAFILEKDKKVD